MKFSITLFVIILSINGLFAQDKKETDEPTLNEEKNIEFYDSYDDWKDRKNKHWQGLDIGINGLRYDDGSDLPPEGHEALQLDYGRSFYFGLNFFEVGMPIIDETFKVVIGLGMDFNNFQLKGNSYMVSQNDTLGHVRDTTWSFKNNNMKSAHITLPLLLAFNTSQKNSTSFHVAVGVIFSYRVWGKQKVVYHVGDLKNEIHRKSQMHQNPWQINATLRLGYANFHIFGNLGLIDYWRVNQGPSAQVWTVGIKVIPW